MDIRAVINSLEGVAEAGVALHFNISIAVIRDIRSGMDISDWRRGKHNKVYFTDSGLEKIMEHLGLKTHIPADIPVEVTVAGFAPNPHILICSLEDGSKVNVKVRSQVGFQKGMKLPVRSDPGSPLLYYKGPNPVNPKMERHFYSK